MKSIECIAVFKLITLALEGCSKYPNSLWQKARLPPLLESLVLQVRVLLFYSPTCAEVE